MEQLTINFEQVQQKETIISFKQAKDQKEIFDLMEKRSELLKQARYLYGNRKGAWGRTTIADEKRSDRIYRVGLQIQAKQTIYNLKH